LRLLILNWRDVRSPKAGGAELLTHELAKHLVAAGDDVVWFTSRPDGQPREEDVDGVRVVRRGSELTTRLRAPSFARNGGWDVVVEEINTLPYLAHRWAPARHLLFMPQLAREVWWYEAPLPLAALGYAAEPLYLSTYRDVETVTISSSTLRDLRSIGIAAPIHVLPMATSTRPLATLDRATRTHELAIVGRLVPSKRVDHAIDALALLYDASLTVVGDGPERAALVRRAEQLGVADRVRFLGRVTEVEKREVLQRADALVACAVREGWGLTVTEAAQLGTPTVAYDIPGLRDSVVDGRTGILTEQTPAALAQGIDALFADDGLYERLRTAAWEQARGLTWTRTAQAFERILRAATSPGG
jgi:glycosyltransferase involved in cell wall biosynthesis